MTRLESWSDVLPGTVVSLRRGALTGERVERTKAWTASGPYVSESGVACIRVDIGGAVVSYPLDRVSLGYDEPRALAAVPLATALDPEPEQWTASDLVFSVMGGVIGVYVAGWALAALVDWVAR